MKSFRHILINKKLRSILIEEFIKLGGQENLDKEIIRVFKKASTPIILNELFWAIGSTMISIIVGRMGTEVVAGNSINNVTNQFATLFIFGLSSASSVIIGNTIGKGDYEKVKEYANTICVLSFIMGILSAIVILILRPIIVNLYNVSKSNTKATGFLIVY